MDPQPRPKPQEDVPMPPVESLRVAPMGAHPPEDPHLDPVLIESYNMTEPPNFRDHPESAVEAADIDVDDTIGAE